MEIQEQGIIGGRNAVIEVLRSGRIPDTVYIAEGEQHGSIGKGCARAESRRLYPRVKESGNLDLWSGDGRGTL